LTSADAREKDTHISAQEERPVAFDDKDDSVPFLVLINCEEQYSLWLKGIDVPRGWKVVKEGTRAECGQYVNEVWTDMRPLSLRKSMEEFDRSQGQSG
jgi:MbtH protein